MKIGIKSAVSALLIIMLLVSSIGGIAETSLNAGDFVIYENPDIKMYFTGNYEFEPKPDNETQANMDDYFIGPMPDIAFVDDLYPALYLEIVIENKTNMDLHISTTGGSVNGWAIDESYASLENMDVAKSSKVKTYYTFYNTEFLYELKKAEDLESMQLNFTIMEDRKSSYSVLYRIESEPFSISLSA